MCIYQDEKIMMIRSSYAEIIIIILECDVITNCKIAIVKCLNMYVLKVTDDSFCNQCNLLKLNTLTYI